MMSFDLDYVDSKSQIDLYFELIKQIEVNEYKKLIPNAGELEFEIQEELTKILKANAFLMLYNLIEGTIKNCLWEIFTAIKVEGIPYEMVRIEIQNMMLRSKVKLEFKSKETSVATQIQSIISSVLTDFHNLLPNKKSQIVFESGNLNVEHIQTAFHGHGLNKVAKNHQTQEEAFKVTVRNRNSLAHGDLTFKECGKLYSYTDLEIYKDYIFDYLNRSISETEQFLQAKLYDKSHLPA